MTPPDEYLVVLRTGAVETSFPPGEIIHQVSNRVLVARLARGTDPDLIRGHPRVAYVGQHPPREVLDDLAESERLFVDGWLSRFHEKSDRPGEGLSWDAEGMSPPDLPSESR